MAKPLIDCPIVVLALERLRRTEPVEGRRGVRAAEPELYEAINRIGVDAMGDLEDVSSEVSDAAYRAVWEAALLAMECYRLAHYRLWRQTAVGTLLEQLDPSLARAAGAVETGPDGDGVAEVT